MVKEVMGFKEDDRVVCLVGETHEGVGYYIEGKEYVVGYDSEGDFGVIGEPLDPEDSIYSTGMLYAETPLACMMAWSMGGQKVMAQKNAKNFKLVEEKK